MKKILFLLFASVCILTGVVVLGRYTGILFPAQSVIPLTTQKPTDSSAGQESAATWEIQEVARDLFVPWSIVFTSPNRILVTERNGSVRVIENGQLLEKPIHQFTAVRTEQEEGLMGMTLDPEYATNSYIYFVYAYPQNGNYTNKVVRMTDMKNALTNEVTILDGIPASRYHAGSRVQFGPDKKLYVTTGDATDKKLPQDRNSLGGKILRIESDGSIPTDNPIPGSSIWSLGHRNPQGITWDPTNALMFSTEHGPSGFDGPLGGDEVNIIEKAGNYGWPVVSHNKSQNGMIDPLLVFTPAVAPASAHFYTGSLFPQWKNTLLFGMLKGEGIMVVTFDSNNPREVQSFEKIPGISVGRIRDVTSSANGELYFTTSNDDGRGNSRGGDDKVYKIVRTN